MNQEDIDKIISLKQQISDLKSAKQNNIYAIEHGYYTGADGRGEFPAKCKQHLCDVIVNYYNYEIGKLQNQLDAMTFVITADQLMKLRSESSNTESL